MSSPNKPRVYIETSVISYLTARASNDMITMGRAATTQEWWNNRSDDYEWVVSRYVLDEALAGHPEASKRRHDALLTLGVLSLDEPQTELIARALISGKALPSIAWLDALHIGACASAGVDLLLTWNFKHIANIHQMASIERICRECGFEAARIITPDVLLQMMHASTTSPFAQTNKD
jgi:predicted nucleic acid-binding protein